MSILLAGIVVLITHTLEALTGFGCTVLAVPFITAIFGMHDGIMVLTVIAWLLALYIIITKHKYIVWKKAFTILALMIPTLPLGIYLFQNADQDLFKKILAVFITLVSLFKLITTLTTKEEDMIKYEDLPPFRRRLTYVALLVAGIVHGAFSSGGPLVVLYATRALPDKKNFRATLCFVWATLNTIIIASYFKSSSGFSVETAKLTAWMIPFLIAGIFFGEKIHNKVNSRVFSIVVFAMLFVTGIFMLIM